MTIGIAIVLREGVLIVSDGRTSLINVATVTNDATRKIHVLGKHVQAMMFGISIVTGAAIKAMRNVAMPVEAIDGLKLAAKHLKRGWEHFWYVCPAASPTDPSVRAALLLAGIDSAGPYFATVMVDHANGVVASAPRRDDGCYLVLGGENYGANDAYLYRMAEAFLGQPESAHPGERIVRVARATGKTISDVGKLDPTIGGQIYYRALLADGSVLEGQLNTDSVTDEAEIRTHYSMQRFPDPV